MEKNYILLVEDDPDDEALTLRALEKHHLANEVVVTRDGAEALEHLLGSPDRVLPQVVLLDLKLPKIDGIEVLRRIRASDRTKLLPVVILTSSNEERDIWDSYSFGANSYVRKPVDFGEFSEAVGRLGLYWLLLNQVLPARHSAG
jgi:CheY-like chemotaxis protein